jgi:hypothetical protein
MLNLLFLAIPLEKLLSKFILSNIYLFGMSRDKKYRIHYFKIYFHQHKTLKQ